MMAGAEYLTPDVLRALWQPSRGSLWQPPSRRPDRPAELPEGAEPGLEPGRPRAFQSGGKPPRLRRPVRLHGDLHDAASRRRPRRSTCRSARRCANTPGRQTATSCCRCCCRCSAPPSRCAWLKPMVDAGEIFHPLRWTTARGVALLASAARPGRRRRGRAHARHLARQPPGAPAGDGDRRRARALGARPRRAAGFPHVASTLDGEPLTEAEIHALLAGTDGLVLLRGQWVEVDRARLERAMRQFRDGGGPGARARG